MSKYNITSKIKVIRLIRNDDGIPDVGPCQLSHHINDSRLETKTVIYNAQIIKKNSNLRPAVCCAHINFIQFIACSLCTFSIGCMERGYDYNLICLTMNDNI